MSTTPPVFATWKRWFWPALALTAVLDQASKCWLFSSASDGVALPSWIVRHHNPGMAWSAFDKHPGLVALSTALLVPVLAFVWWRWYRPLGRCENLAFGLILGGALGNGVDRLVLVPLGLAEGVRDFISVDFHPIGISYIWPTFNIADAGICIGFILLILAGLLPGQAKPRPATTA